MDIANANPNTHNDQEQFPIGDGRFLGIPTVAKGQAITAASRKLQRGFEIYEGVVLSLPQAEAGAIAAAVVDPSRLRNDIDRKRVSMHRTPSGYTLVSLEARVWSAAVSCDGANGRGRLEVKLAGEDVWPLPEESDATPSMRYRTRDVQRMRKAAYENARRILSPDMRQSLRDHPHGVWNPVYVLPGLVIEQPDAEAEPEEAGFVHVAEGSTRVVGCQEGLGLPYDTPLAYAGSTIDLVRRARASVAGAISLRPGNEDAHHQVKVLTLPAHIIVGVLDEELQVSSRPFPEIISEFVESIHEQPRPWNAFAQGAVRGERLVAALVEEGHLTPAQGNDVVRRDEHRDITTAPNVIAGRLLRATSHPDAREIVRKAILEDTSRQNLTRKRYAQTVGPLLLTIYDAQTRQKTAAAALTNEFRPDALKDAGWKIRDEVDIPTLRDDALAALHAHPDAWSPAGRELVARGTAALTSLGLLLSDQGSAVGSQAWLRGSVARVINNLALCQGGIKIIAEAIEHVEGRQQLPPALYNPGGTPKLIDGEEQRLTAQGDANMKLRELAFRAERPVDDDSPCGDDLSPYDRFLALQREFAAACTKLTEIMGEVRDVRDDAGEPLVNKHGLRQEIVGELPAKLAALRDRIVRDVEDDAETLADPDEETKELNALEAAMTSGYGDADEAA